MKTLYVSLFCLSVYSLNVNADNSGSSPNLSYQKGQKINDLSDRTNFKSDYESGGRYVDRVYSKQSPNVDVDFDRNVEVDDIIECAADENNLSTIDNEGFRTMHNVFGRYDETNDKVVLGDNRKAIKFDATSVKYGNQDLNMVGNAVEKITQDIIDVYRNNGTNRRFCKHSDLSKDGIETSVSKTFCSAGMTTGIYSGYELDAAGLLPRCGLVLDKDIKIGEIRYLQQVIHPQRYYVGYDNVGIGQGAVICEIRNGQPYLRLFEGESRKCNMLINLQEPIVSGD